MFVCVCARTRFCVCVCVGGYFSVAIAIVKCPVLPLYVEDGRCRNLLYYYYWLDVENSRLVGRKSRLFNLRGENVALCVTRLC